MGERAGANAFYTNEPASWRLVGSSLEVALIYMERGNKWDRFFAFTMREEPLAQSSESPGRVPHTLPPVPRCHRT